MLRGQQILLETDGQGLSLGGNRPVISRTSYITMFFIYLLYFLYLAAARLVPVNTIAMQQARWSHSHIITITHHTPITKSAPYT